MTKRLWLSALAGIGLAVGTYWFATTLPRDALTPYYQDTNPNRINSKLIDLNGDGAAERIVFENGDGNTAIVYFYDGISNEYQHNFRSPWHPPSSRFIIGDYDRDDQKEVYAVQYENDSVFISGVEYPNEVVLNRCYIASGFSDINSSTARGWMVHFDEESNGQLALLVMGGYGARPRNICLYDFDQQTWTYSADSVQSYFMGINPYDLTRDGVNELIAWGRAPDNNHGPEFFSDQDSYLMVFDQDLQLLDWIKAEGLSSNIIFTQYDGHGYVVKNDQSPDENSTVFRYEKLGIQEAIDLSRKARHLSKPIKIGGQYYMHLGDYNNRHLQEMEPGFKLTDIHSIPKNLDFYGDVWYVDQMDFLVMRNHLTSNIYYWDDIEKPMAKMGSWPYGPVRASGGLFRGVRSVLVSSPGMARLFELSTAWYWRLRIPISMLCGAICFTIGYIVMGKKKDHITDVDRDFVRLNTRTGFELIPKSRIIYCKADGKYTHVETADNGSIVASINLGTLEPMVVSKDITRVGRSLLINMSFLRKVERKKNGQNAPHAIFIIRDKEPIEVPLTKNEVKLLSELLT